MSLNHVGEAAGTRDAYLIKSRTVKGDPVYRINDAKDFKVGDSDPALVIRTSDNGEWSWKPITDVAQLSTFLSKATPQERQEQIGLWVDRRHFPWIHGKDGVVQDDEVTPIGKRWGEYVHAKDDSEYDTQYGQNKSWSTSYSTVDAGNVSVETRQTPSGPLAVLHEPSTITLSKVDITTTWGLTGAGWTPAFIAHYTCTPGEQRYDGETRHVL